MTLIDGELRAALRAEAAVHRPDREAMLDRITQTAMRNHVEQRRSPRLRVTGAAVAVAAVLGGGGFAQWAVAGDSEPHPGPTPPVVVTVEPVPSGPPPSSLISPSGTPSATPSKPPRTSRSPSRSASPSATAGRTATGTGSTTPVNDVLWADGSVAPDGGSQASSVVTVTTRERLTALEVTIRVVRNADLVARGGSQQVPGASVTSTVVEERDVVVWRFVLSSGDTLEPGTYTFYARYTHAEGGRDANRDSYAAAGTLVSGAAPTVSGDFR